MKLNYFILCCLVLGMTACGPGVSTNRDRPIFTDTMKLHLQNRLKSRKLIVLIKAGNGCNVVKFTYPYFLGAKNLDDSVMLKLNSMFSLSFSADTNFKQIAKKFFTGYNSPSSRDPQKPPFLPVE